MATPKVLSHDIGEFIRDLRQNARISLRQLAEQAGVSNPYLSQIERGLRKPSAEVLQQLATALRVSTPMMYLRAGLLDLKDGQGVLAAIANDTDLTEVQKQTLTQIYDTFRRENARGADAEPPPPPTSTPRSARRSARSVATDDPATGATASEATTSKATTSKATASKATPQRSMPKKTAKVATATEKE